MHHKKAVCGYDLHRQEQITEDTSGGNREYFAKHLTGIKVKRWYSVYIVSCTPKWADIYTAMAEVKRHC